VGKSGVLEHNIPEKRKDRLVVSHVTAVKIGTYRMRT